MKLEFARLERWDFMRFTSSLQEREWTMSLPTEESAGMGVTELFSEYEPVVGEWPWNANDINVFPAFSSIPGIVPSASHIAV